MANVKYGLTSWDDVVLGGNNQSRENRKDKWLRLNKGSNVVRIVTLPHEYLTHNFKEEGDKGFGTKIKCSKFHGSCPICDMVSDERKELRAKRRWFVEVIDRKTQTLKTLDISSAIFGPIQKYSRMEVWGSPFKYDIDIQVDPSAGPQGYYTVAPLPHSPLSPADLEMKDSVNLDELKRLTTPPTPEEVRAMMNRYLEKNGGKAQMKNGKAAVAMEDEGEYSFPPVE